MMENMNRGNEKKKHKKVKGNQYGKERGIMGTVSKGNNGNMRENFGKEKYGNQRKEEVKGKYGKFNVKRGR